MRPDPQLIVCWAAKGGSGTTVTCATAALTHPGPVLLVGLDNDLPDVLATTPPPHGGVGGWLTSGQPRDHLDRLTPRTIDASTRFLTGGRPTHGDITNDRWTRLADWLHQQPGTVIVDAGTRTPPQGLLDAADRRLLVTRNCYLALRQALLTSPQPDGLVVLRDPARPLTEHDVEAALHTPAQAVITLTTDVARAVDAGLLATAATGMYRHELTGITGTRPTAPPTPSTAQTILDNWANQTQPAVASVNPEPPHRAL